MASGILAGGRNAVAIGSLSIILSSGCGWVENQFTTDPAFGEKTNDRSVATPGAGATFDLLTDCIPAERTGGACSVSTLNLVNQYMNQGNVERAALLRDRLQDYLLMRSDQMCERHRSGILSTQSIANFGLNTITSGLAATAAIVVAPATNILAALGAITVGTRSAFNADIYQKFVAPAVVKKINETRGQKLQEILDKRSTQPADATRPRAPVPATVYTPEAAVGDVERYNQYCSFAWGLSVLADTSQKFSDTAPGIQQRIDSLRKQQIDNATQIQNLVKLGKDGQDVGRLREINSDISRQIMILQHQMLTAPLTIDPKPGTG
jgi:hypothetical protein